ncbi:PIN domain-containing protein [Candidatus Bathyarchaeota archaeon]|nr:PIN domain-containing protein [Candidatus Bathyarchaeota archaeon]
MEVVNGMLIGLDTNILCYSLDSAYPENLKLKHFLIELSAEKNVAINPTVLHETYHTLVYSQKWLPEEAQRRLRMILMHPYIRFFSQTKRVSILALNLAVKHKLGGRDALIVANYLINKVPIIYTHDENLLKLKEISWGNFHTTLKDPLTEAAV